MIVDVDRPLRVLTLVDGIGTYGGGETLARQLAMSLDQTRFEPFFCVSRWEPLDEYERGLVELEEAGVPFMGLRRKSKADIGAWRKLVGYMRREKIDILHSHKIGSNIWGALVAPIARVPVFVAQEHSWSFEGQPLRRLLDRELIARRADAFVAVSRQDKRRMHAVEGIPLEKLRLIPNGIPIPARCDAPPELRTELGLAHGQPVIGMVATLRPPKTVDVLVRATAFLVRQFPDLRVLIIGGEVGGETGSAEPERERLHQLAQTLGVTENVCLLGYREDVPSLLSLLDVAVLSSDSEGSPLSILEYMEAGKPVVASRVGGVPDMVEDGVTGLLVDPQDPDGLARAVASLLSDRTKAAEMGRAGHERRRREFSLETMTGRVEDLYRELYAKKAAGR